MKKAIYRTGSLLLALCMGITLFTTGCKKSPEDTSDEYSYYVIDPGSTTVNNGSGGSGNNDNAGTTSDGTNATASQSGNTASQSTGKSGSSNEVVNNCYVSGTRIAKDPVEFKIMIRDHANGLAKYNNSAFATYVKENFGITLKFNVVSIGSVSEQTSLAYAGNNSLPDMFWGMAGTRSLHTPFIASGKVVNLTPYIQKYAPNIQKMMKEVPDAKYLTTFDDGNTYYLPMYRDQDNYSWKFFINKTWLSNLGLKMPKTTNNFHDVLKAFKEKDANKNGSTGDEIPLVIAAGESGVGQIPLSLFSPFGMYAYTNAWCANNSNKVKYAYATEEYRNGLRFYHKLYEEGLLYSAFRGATYSQIKQWTGKSVQTVGVFAANTYSEATTDDSFLNNYMVMNPIGTSGSGKWLNTPFENVWPDWFVMTKNCKYPEIAMRLLDWLYSEEGTLTALYGPAGKNRYWEYDSKGNIVLHKNNIPSGKTVNEYCYSMTPGYPIPHYLSASLQAKIQKASASSESAAAKAYGQQLKTMYASKSVKGFPQVYMTNKELASISGDYKSEAITWQWNFIGGTASLDNDWDAYLKKLNKLGLEKDTATYQKAYNRYLTWQKNNQ
ncbi:MAG: extracellular solute-binding protein [Clostridia bacterium]|nr:extracellular solute-binding protein [Clostridia bacterium]